MGNEAKELLAFMKGIAENPSDVSLRRVFADWLDEHDEPEEAQIYREWDQERCDAEKYVRDFCQRYGADYNGLLADVAAGDGYCFGDDDGPYEIRNNEDLWKHIAVLIQSEPNRDQSFRCAC